MHTANAVALTGSAQAVLAGAGYFVGLAVVETGGTNAATVRVYDNPSAASGTLVAAVNLAAGTSADISLPVPVWCTAGLYVDVGGTGTVAGSIRVG